MGNVRAAKILGALTLGILLAQLSPVAAGVLLCVAEEADAACCDEPLPADSRTGESERVRSSACGCCVLLDAAPSAAGPDAPKVSIGVPSDGKAVPDAVSPATTPVARRVFRDPADSALDSLRTVVLLI